MSECIFCKLQHNKESFLFETETFFVIHDLYPQDNTHLLFISKEHIESLKWIRRAEEEKVIADIIVGITRFANQHHLKHWITQVNTGKESGQNINHLHFHLISSCSFGKKEDIIGHTV